MACSRCDTGRGVSLVVLILALIVANAAMGSDPSICAAHGPRAGRALVCVIFIAVLWAAELVPLTVTSLLPIVVFPFANVLSGRDTARLYFNNTQFVLVGTSLVAVALERYDLHRHFALRVVRAVGTSPRRLILAFMVATACLSMFLTNTGTTVLMLPIVTETLTRLDAAATTSGGIALDAAGGVSMRSLDRESRRLRGRRRASASRSSSATASATRSGSCDREPHDGLLAAAAAGDDGNETGASLQSPVVRQFATLLLLSIAYASTVGGMTTITGTGTNVASLGLFAALYPDGPDLSFFTWLLATIPICALLLLLVWGVLSCRFGRGDLPPISAEALDARLAALGRVSFEGKVVLVTFVLVIVAWLTRAPGFMVGWADLLAVPENATDATVAMAGAIVLMIIPRSTPTPMPGDRSKLERILPVSDVSRAPWPTILLLGGGFALAGAVQDSGLAVCLADGLFVLDALPPVLLVAAVCVASSAASELMSNVAVVSVMTPVLAAMSTALHLNPLAVIIPVTLSCSTSFLLPVSTPPNSIVYGTGLVSNGQMLSIGLAPKVIGLILVVVGNLTVGYAVWGIDIKLQPGWAEVGGSSDASG